MDYSNGWYRASTVYWCISILSLQNTFKLLMLTTCDNMSLNSSTVPLIFAVMCFCKLIVGLLLSNLRVFESITCEKNKKKKQSQDRIWVCIWLDFFPSIWLCTLQHCESALKWEPACYCICSVAVMLSGPHFWVLFVVCQFLTVRDRSEAISPNLQFKLGPLQPDYKSTFRALRSSRRWMVDISNHSAVNPSVR